MPDSLNNLHPDAIFDMPQVSVLAMTGEQKSAFLQGQLTANINQWPADSALRSAHCDHKGKAWSVLTVMATGEEIWLAGHPESLAASQAQFEKYGVFSKISLEMRGDVTPKLLTGRAAELISDKLFGGLPARALAAAENEYGVAVRADYPAGAVTVYLTETGKAAFDHETGEETFAQYGSEVCEALLIQQGLPEIASPNINEYVPQMFNLQALHGIDFKKGCYMGQEVVARTRYLGKNKRAAYVLRSVGSLDVKPGDTIERQLGENWRRAGTVLRSAALSEETWVLAVLPNDITEEDTLRLSGAEEARLSIQPLPYDVDNDEKNSILKRKS